MKKIGEAFFAVDSQVLSCEELTLRIGCAPDFCWSNGEAYESFGKERFHTFSRWAVSESAFDSVPLESTVDHLVSRLESSAAQIIGLPPGQRTALSVCLNEENDVFGLGISAKALGFFARLGAELDMSFVVSRGKRGC